MLDINTENRASTKLNLSLMKNIDGAKFHFVIFNHVNSCSINIYKKNDSFITYTHTPFLSKLCVVLAKFVPNLAKSNFLPPYSVFY